MNFKYIVTSYFAILGIVGSVFGLTSLMNQDEISISVNDSEKSSSEKTSSPVCSSHASDVFSQDESQIFASEYSKNDTAECLFVGCGGII